MEFDWVEYEVNKRIKNNCMYHIGQQTGIKTCNNCPFKDTWKNRCRKFSVDIERVQQRNLGFHHIPCKECLESKLQQKDIEVFRKFFKAIQNKRKK